MKSKERNYLKDLNDWENYFYCNNCGTDTKNDFTYSRTVANGEVWCCKFCKNETLVEDQPKEYDN